MEERPAPSPDFAGLLHRAASGDAPANLLVGDTIYQEMRRIAAAHMARERQQVTLQATAVAHEAYLRLLGHTTLSKDDKIVWLRAFSKACRQVLIDAHRRRKSVKRGKGWQRVEFDSQVCFGLSNREDLDFLDLHEALESMGQKYPRAAEVANLRGFVGLTMPEIAAALGVSLRTVEKDWELAKAELHRILNK